MSIKNAAQETQAAFMPVQEEPSARPAPNKAPSSAQKKTAPTITEMADQFIYRDKTKSPGIIRDTGKTIGLFVEAFGDKPVEQADYRRGGWGVPGYALCPALDARQT